MKNLMTFIIKSLFFVTVGFATTINIPADYSTIQAGIDATIDGDTVLVQSGTYVENINFNGKNIVVGSLFLTTQDTSYISQTVIDGNESGSVVTFESGEDSTTFLSGFTIKNGWNPTHGGGILCSNSSPNLEHLIVSGNGTDQQGGGIDCRSNSNPQISNVTIQGNIAEDGGGIHFLSSSPTLIDVTIMGNTGGNGGGASAWWGSNPIFKNVTITANTAPAGDAVYSMASNPVIVNSILWGTCQGQIDINFSDIQGGWEGESNINSDPLFVDSANGDFNLEEGSPCIDAGTALFIWEGVTLIDLLPNEYVGTAPDMGAYEYGSTVSINNLTAIPYNYSLNQNYPNPFNPTTTIQYELPQRSEVQVTIYDLLGRKVTTLMNQTQDAGYKSVIWNATNDHGKPVSAGVYLCQIRAGVFVQTKKMVLLK